MKGRPELRNKRKEWEEKERLRKDRIRRNGAAHSIVYFEVSDGNGESWPSQHISTSQLKICGILSVPCFLVLSNVLSQVT